ncbi:hypothetical protein ACLMJK_002396 [Lecanora helva]
MDVEQDAVDNSHLTNTNVRKLAWQNISVETNSRKGDLGPKAIMSGIDGCAEAGQLTALMGPSGSGKTTLLNVLARRGPSTKLTVSGEVTVNGESIGSQTFRSITSYVEQEDALIGSLTVRETLDFAARLALPSAVARHERKRRIDQLLASFGLQNQANSIVGTPIRKGISGGQKRRLSIASQLITAPQILFLDEPTSGLDSTASYEVIKYLKSIVKEHRLIVIASIHQPSTSLFDLFDNLLLLSAGQTCYNGNLQSLRPYFERNGYPMPIYVNPAEFLLDITSVDFAHDEVAAHSRLKKLHSDWLESLQRKDVLSSDEQPLAEKSIQIAGAGTRSSFVSITLALLHRSFIKSYRDVVAYGIRLVMYLGLAIMMGTVWLRLPTTQSSIGPFTNAIFFGSAFMSFMAVAYVPAFLEDRATFIKERANGLYGSTAFMVANFLIGLPYLFFISLLFSLIAYFLTNFRPTGAAFFVWVMWLFLDLLAGESLVVLVSSIFPNFVIALALTAFANGLWMSVGGFLVSPSILNPFWKYVFHYIDYQAYVFRGMMVNEFGYRTFDCGRDCHCMYQTELASQCKIDGRGVLQQYGYKNGNTGKWVGIMLAIILVYRILGWGVTWIRKT